MNKENLQWLLLVVMMAGLIGVGVVVFNQSVQLAELSRTPITNSSQKTILQPEQLNSNILDIFTNKPGDKVAGLTVASIGPIPGINSPFGTDNIDAKFSGTVTISGTYSYEFSDFFGSDISCFAVSNALERAKLPTLAGVEDQNKSFCFRNTQKAKELLGQNYGSGTATVVIANFELIYAPAEVSNLADLVSAIDIKRDAVQK